MEYSKRLHRFMKFGILVISMVLLLSAVPFTETTEASSFEVYGWVTDQSDNDAIEDVKVTLFDPDDGKIRSYETDEFGAFSIDAPAGHYIIQYSHPRYITPTFPVQVNEEELNLRTIQLFKINEDDASLTGRVKDSDGFSGMYAYVYLIDTNGAHDGEDLFGQSQPNTMMVRADRNGNYQFDDAYEGSFKLMARMGSSRYHFGDEMDVTLNAGANNAPSDLVYNDWGNDNSVYVKPFNSQGFLVRSAEIIFYDPVLNMWNSTTSSPGGVSVQNGTYDLIVRAMGYRTFIQQVVVNGDTQIDVDLEDAEYTTTETDVTIDDWGNATYQSTVTYQYDHGPRSQSNEYRMFASGIFRYDLERFFGDGNGVFAGHEINNYENFLETTLGPDGETTRNDFKVKSSDFSYSNFMVDFAPQTDNVRANNTVVIDYSYDLTTEAEESTVYQVYYAMNERAMSVDESIIQNYMENVMFNLPAGYEVTYEKVCGSCYFNVEHAENDTLIVYVNGTYENGKSGYAEFHVRENLVPTPVIDVTDDYVPMDDIYLYRADEYIEFNGTHSYDTSNYGRILGYEWTFEDATRLNEKNYTATAVRKFDEGIYNVTLKVMDNAGGFGEKTITVIIDNTAPVVAFTAEPAMVDQGSVENEKTMVYLNITTLEDTNGIFEKFSWDMGDGTIRNLTSWDDRNTTYHWAILNITKLTGENEYTYTIQLTVWDNAGNENTATQDVKVNNTKRPEVTSVLTDDAIPGDDYHVFTIGENITFNASTSEGIGSELTNYSWDFDGDGNEDSSEMVENWSFATAGMKTVKLTVTDEYGGTTTHEIEIYIDDAAPEVHIDFENGWMNEGWYWIDLKNNTNDEGQYLMIFSANGTKDIGDLGELDGIANFSWSFGQADITFFGMNFDGNLSIMNTTHQFTSIDTTAQNVTFDNETYHYYYTVTLRVWDRAGNMGMDSVDIIVNDTQAPIAKFTYETGLDQGTPMDLNATESEDNIGIANYTWIIEDMDGEFSNITDGKMIENVNFDKFGTYTVTLIVTDGSGNTDEHESSIEMNRVPSPDVLVTGENIFYSDNDTYEGDKITILAEITNVGDKEAFNISVSFFFRTDADGELVPIDTFDFPDPLVPTESRLANVTYKLKESGQIVVNVSLTNDTQPDGLPNVDENLENNEAFQDIYVQEEDDEFPWMIVGAVSIIIVIIVVAILIFLFKPELIGLRPAAKTSKKSGRSKKK